jgi:hypothetical protein
LRRSCCYNPGKNSLPPPYTAASLNTPQATSEVADGHNAPRQYGGDGTVVLTGEITAAIDAKLGLASGEKLTLIPMTDAPLFGLLDSRPVVNRTVHHSDGVLPPRKQADWLMKIYWEYLHPIEPFLDYETFTQSYESLFSGNPIVGDESVFISTVNIVFALSTQIQEKIRPSEREEVSKVYFQRAWNLLRPEAVIWEAGSVELVQCLLLMSRYLQCTNNPHKTWMATGSAIRIAQSLGLHVPEASPSTTVNSVSRRKRQLWQCCSYMDKYG